MLPLHTLYELAHSLAYHVFYQLWSVATHGFDSLEDVHLTMLNHLFNASVGGTVHSTPTSAIPDTYDSGYTEKIPGLKVLR